MTYSQKKYNEKWSGDILYWLLKVNNSLYSNIENININVNINNVNEISDCGKEIKLSAGNMFSLFVN